jgi:hypothetical protein
MKQHFRTVLTMALCIGAFIAPRARGQAVTGTNTSFTGPLAGLGKAAAKAGFDDKIPAKLCRLLWPASGAVTTNCAVRKVAMEGDSEDEKRMILVRMDTHDIVFAHTIVTKPKEDLKMRREYYYRVNARGDLALALKATFRFNISDVDNDVLQSVSWETYGEKAGDDGETLAITPEVTAQFKVEKKFWLKQEKAMNKMERDPAQ